MPLNTEVDYNNVVIKGTVELGVRGERGLQGFKGDQGIQGPPVPVAHELGDDPDLAVSQKLLTDSIADMEQSNSNAVMEATHQAGLAMDSAVTASEQATIATNKAGESAHSAQTSGQQATTATEQAGIATIKAGEASISAVDAASSAGLAADSETAAEQAATIATNKADEASQSAQAAAQSATQAEETLDDKVDKADIAQVTGSATDKVMSQKAVTEYIGTVLGSSTALDFTSEKFVNGTAGPTFPPSSPNLSRLRLAYPIEIAKDGGFISVHIPQDVNLFVSIIQGELSGETVSNSGWQENSFTMPALANYASFLVSKPDNSSISPQDLDGVGIYADYNKKLSFVTKDQIESLPKISQIEKYKNTNQAHGGVTTFGAPFNSIDAFITAALMGFKVMEADIVMTADNEFLVSHEATINSTYFTNADGSQITTPVAVNSLTLSQIKANYQLKGSIEKYRKTPQTLEDFLMFCMRYDVFPQLEVKQMDILQVESFIEKTRMYFNDSDINLITFNRQLAAHFASYSNYAVGCLTHTASNATVDADIAIGVFSSFNLTTMTDSVRSYAASKNHYVAAYTITNSSNLNRMIDFGIKFLATDHMPPMHGLKGEKIIEYSSKSTFDGFSLTNATVDGGLLKIQAGGNATFAFNISDSNNAFVSDIWGAGDFTVSLIVGGVTVDSVALSSTEFKLIKLNRLFSNSGSAMLQITASAGSEISDIYFKAVNCFS